MIDLHGLFRARWFGRRGAPQVPLYAPAGVLDLVAALEEGDADAVRQIFDWHEMPGSTMEVGPFLLETRSLPHFVTNAGIRLTCSAFTVAYTGDTGPDPGLTDLGRGADLYIVEATSRNQQKARPPSRPPTPEPAELTGLPAHRSCI